MEGIVRSVTEHPLVAMAVCFAVLLIVYFLFKSLIKLALILILVAVAIGGYFYFQYPESQTRQPQGCRGEGPDRGR